MQKHSVRKYRKTNSLITFTKIHKIVKIHSLTVTWSFSIFVFQKYGTGKKISLVILSYVSKRSLKNFKEQNFNYRIAASSTMFHT